ncbi:MAG: hypothetical protein PHS33_07925 [Candidatus Omnitrophica bacterium]|nr:hypothetical protein [Candidatus Omnitrophota bacterium]
MTETIKCANYKLCHTKISVNYNNDEELAKQLNLANWGYINGELCCDKCFPIDSFTDFSKYVLPYNTWVDERIDVLSEHIQNFIKEKKAVPLIWIREYNKLIDDIRDIFHNK